MPEKTGKLKPEVEKALRSYQKRIYEEAEKFQERDAPFKKMVIHGLGTGKTITSIAASDALQNPALFIVPAALRPKTESDIEKFTEDKNYPTEVISYDALPYVSQDDPILSSDKKTVVLDEIQRMRNLKSSLRSQLVQQAVKPKDNVILLTGTPIVNNPTDLVLPINILTGKNYTPEEFEREFVEKTVSYPNLLSRIFGIRGIPAVKPKNVNKLKSLLKGKIDYFIPEEPLVPVTEEDYHVEMSGVQNLVYSSIWKQIPVITRLRLSKWSSLSNDELQNLQKFLSGPRQVSLSVLPYLKNYDPLLAYKLSPKLHKAMELLKEEFKDPRKKALVFSNFVTAGLIPYAAALEKAKIPYRLFHGAITDKERKQIVDEYNEGKIRVVLLSPAGMEGLSFKGTNIIQILDPHWNAARIQQAIGRGIRANSHIGLPSELQNVKVQKFYSKKPLGFFGKIKQSLGLNTQQQQETVDDILYKISDYKLRSIKAFMNLLKDIGQNPEDTNVDLTKIKNLDKIVKKSSDSKFGIPNDLEFGNLENLKKDQLVDFLIQKHDAEKAGPHFDIRIGTPEHGLFSWATRKELPKPGEKRLLIQQPLHDYEYKDFEGEIPKGEYGAGKVKKELEGKILITKLEPDAIHFTTGWGKIPERFVLIRPKNKEKTKHWLLLNTTVQDPPKFQKLKYTQIKPEHVKEFLEKIREDFSVQPKIDGAATVTKFIKDKLETLSHRISVTGKPIVHTERLFKTIPQINPPEYAKDLEFIGELYGINEKGEAIEPQELGGILNASLEKSLDKQKKIKLKNMLFDVYGDKIKNLPYKQRHELVKKFVKDINLPQIEAAEGVSTIEEAENLLKDIEKGKHKLTREGIIIHKQHGKPIKVKLTNEHDVYIRRIFEGEGKYTGKAAGGFEYSLTPDGPIVGRVGTGFDDETRKDLWENKDYYTGRKAKIHARGQYESGAYRAPSFIAFHEDYPNVKSSSNDEKLPVLDRLLKAKFESDRKNWDNKEKILRELMLEKPNEFIIDQYLNDKIVGIRHVPTNFKIHTKIESIPVKLVDVSFNKEILDAVVKYHIAKMKKAQKENKQLELLNR